MEEIRDLLSRYCHAMDAADFGAVGELFADAALCDADGNVLARGRDGVREFYVRIVILYDGSPRTLHVTANPVIELDGDTAAVRSSYVVYHGVDGPPVPMITGRYLDTFQRVRGAWRFHERRYTVELAGDLSRHLRLSALQPDG
jgi:ketosteroid isomerase-like protein